MQALVWIRLETADAGYGATVEDADYVRRSVVGNEWPIQMPRTGVKFRRIRHRHGKLTLGARRLANHSWMPWIFWVDAKHDDSVTTGVDREQHLLQRSEHVKHQVASPHRDIHYR